MENAKLFNAVQDRVNKQREALATQQAQIQDINQQPQELDLSSLMALTDAWTGSNFMKSYKRPKTKQELAKESLYLQQGIDARSQDLLSNEIKLLQLLGKKDKPGASLTPGQKKLDETFAKDYAEFFAGGGYADVEKNASQLDEAIETLKNVPDVTGPWIGTVPSSLQRRFFPEAANTRQAVEEVVQRNLRLVLGAQFTEKEGNRLIERAYDPLATQEENAKRITRLKKQILEAARAKQSAAEYFEANGTLDGYKGSQKYKSANDFLKEFKPSSSNKKKEKEPPKEETKTYEGVTYKKVGDQWVPQK